MPKKKIFHVSFYIDLHAVTSPGVWLCPKGKVSVRVTLFGVSEVTKLLPPIFPLLYHERFHFQKVYKKAGCLPVLEEKLASVPVRLQLFQHPEGTTSLVKLAFFKACLGDLLFPPSGGDFNLMFSPTKSYPGIIAPIAEISTRLSLNESEIEDGTMTLPYTILSKENGESERPKGKGIVRQKAVCHTKQYKYCNCFSVAPPKCIPPTNKRKSNGEWTKRDLSPAHFKSHRNFDRTFQPSFRQYKSDTSLDTYDNKNMNNCRPCHTPFNYQEQKHYIRNENLQDNQEDIYLEDECMSDKEEYIDTSHNYNKPKLEHSFKKNRDRTSPLNYLSTFHNAYGHYKEDKVCSDPCEFKEKDYVDTTKSGDEAIKQLKKQLKELLEEEENLHKQSVCHCNNQERNMICCLCCPKERQNHDLEIDGHKNINKKLICPIARAISCSKQCGAACTRSNEGSSDSNNSNFEENIRKRPMFYSSLHAAYEKLYNNRKSKKFPVWR